MHRNYTSSILILGLIVIIIFSSCTQGDKYTVNPEKFINYLNTTSVALEKLDETATAFKRGQVSVSGQPYVYATGTEIISVIVNHLINEDNLIFSYYDNNYDGTAESLPLTELLEL